MEKNSWKNLTEEFKICFLSFRVKRERGLAFKGLTALKADSLSYLYNAVTFNRLNVHVSVWAGGG